jgi:CrcB protein
VAVSLEVWIAVGLLGGSASVARSLLSGLVTAAPRTSFPLGTLVVNVSGALALGLLVGLRVHGTALVLLGTATLGTFTTFSTWMLESHRLGGGKRIGPAAINLGASLAMGLAAVFLGRLVG